MGNRAMVKAAGRWMAALVLAAVGMGCDADECADYEDEAGTQVTLRFTNNTAAPVYLGTPDGCGRLKAFTVRDSSGQERPWYVGDCGMTCELMQGEPLACPAVCESPPVYRIDPGGHYDMQWDGLLLEQREMPAECTKQSLSAVSCQQRVLAPAGSYELTGTVYTAVDCDPATASCDCTASPEGWCEVPTQGKASGSPLTATVTAALPETALVELVFQ